VDCAKVSEILVGVSRFIIAELITENALFFPPDTIVEMATRGSWELVRVICDSQKLPLALPNPPNVSKSPQSHSQRNGGDDLPMNENETVAFKENGDDAGGQFKPGDWFLLGDRSDVLNTLHKKIAKMIPADHKLLSYFQHRFLGLVYIADLNLFFNDPRNLATVASILLSRSQNSLGTKGKLKSYGVISKPQIISPTMIQNYRNAAIEFCDLEHFKTLVDLHCFRNFWDGSATRAVRRSNSEKKMLYLIENGLIELSNENVVSFLTCGMMSSFKKVVPSVVPTVKLQAKDLFPSFNPVRIEYETTGQMDVLVYAFKCGAIKNLASIEKFEDLFGMIVGVDLPPLVDCGLVPLNFDTFRRFAIRNRRGPILRLVDVYGVSRADEISQIFEALAMSGEFHWVVMDTVKSAEFGVWNAFRFGLRRLPIYDDESMRMILESILKAGRVEEVKFLDEEMSVDFAKVANTMTFFSKTGAQMRQSSVECYLYLLMKGIIAVSLSCFRPIVIHLKEFGSTPSLLSRLHF